MTLASGDLRGVPAKWAFVGAGGYRWLIPSTLPTGPARATPGKGPPITLDDVMRRFAALSDMGQPPEHAHVRGTVLAVGMEWVIHLPECKAKDAALERLAEAAELACAAYDLAAD